MFILPIFHITDTMIFTSMMLMLLADDYFRCFRYAIITMMPPPSRAIFSIID